MLMFLVTLHFQTLSQLGREANVLGTLWKYLVDWQRWIYL